MSRGMGFVEYLQVSGFHACRGVLPLLERPIISPFLPKSTRGACLDSRHALTHCLWQVRALRPVGATPMRCAGNIFLIWKLTPQMCDRVAGCWIQPRPRPVATPTCMGTGTCKPVPFTIPVKQQCFLWQDFLAAPLLPTIGWQELKFCGNDYNERISDDSLLCQVIQAYIHHTLVDSQGMILLADIQGLFLYFVNEICLIIEIGFFNVKEKKLILFDPQGHSVGLGHRLGHWDLGGFQLNLFYSRHVCNSICLALKLHEEATLIGGEQTIIKEMD